MERKLQPLLSDREIEKALIFEQSARLKQRAPGKYETMLLAIKISPTLELCYHFGRDLDDKADGDVPLPDGFSDIPTYLNHLKKVILEEPEINGSESSTEFLMKRSWQRLTKAGRPSDDIKGLFLDFLEGMEEEYRLRSRRAILTKAELVRLYEVAFNPPQDIALIAIGSKTRSKDVPELAQIQGRLYSVADLGADLSVGVCRIPKEVLEESKIEGNLVFENYNSIKDSPDIRNWINSELLELVRMKNDLSERKMDAKAKLLCKFLTFRVKIKLNRAGIREINH